MPETKKQIPKAGTIQVTRHYPRENDSETEYLEVQTFDVHPAEISVACGMTYNLGEYESARVDVRVTLPCYVEEIDAAYRKASTMVEAKGASLAKDVAEYKKRIGRR